MYVHVCKNVQIACQLYLLVSCISIFDESIRVNEYGGMSMHDNDPFSGTLVMPLNTNIAIKPRVFMNKSLHCTFLINNQNLLETTHDKMSG